MSNETTASQPKSIGDDAQFRALFAKWDSVIPGVNDETEVMQELISYIDNFRASAAQASATIKAAPTDEQILKIAAEQDYGDEDPKCIIRLARALFAATIQEPVMVAEPVPGCRMQGGICSCTSGGSFGGCRIERGFPEQRAVFAAPMVAEPAGVELCVVPRTILQATLDNLENDWLQPDGEWCRAEDTLESSISRGDEPVISSLRAILAATVKAVPSEALALKRWQECLDVSFCSTEGDRQFVSVTFPRPVGDYASTSAEFEAAVDLSLAAPLAEKTGGAA